MPGQSRGLDSSGGNHSVSGDLLMFNRFFFPGFPISSSFSFSFLHFLFPVLFLGVLIKVVNNKNENKNNDKGILDDDTSGNNNNDFNNDINAAIAITVITIVIRFYAYVLLPKN